MIKWNDHKPAQQPDAFRLCFQRFNASKNDHNDALRQNRDVEGHPGVLRVAKQAEVRILKVDYKATEESVLVILRHLFDNARAGVQPWHDMLPCGMLSVRAQDAIISVTLDAPRKKRFLSQTHIGSGVVKVMSEEVAQMLVAASEKPEVNSAPPGKEIRPIKVLGGKRRERSRPCISDQEAMHVAAVDIIDVDFWKVLETNGRKKPSDVYAADRLWSKTMSGAWIDLKKRALVLQYSERCMPSHLSSNVAAAARLMTAAVDALSHIAVRQIHIPLATIKLLRVLQDHGRDFRGSDHALALRTRRPAYVTISHDRPDTSGGSIASSPDYRTATDPSGAAEAFASPTAHFCLRFSSDEDYRHAIKQLSGFKLRVQKDQVHVSTQRGTSSPGRGIAPSPVPVSHHLPSAGLVPLTAADVAAAGDDRLRIEYALECLLKRGLLRQRDVAAVLMRMRDLWRWGRLAVFSEALESWVEALPNVDRCNKGHEVLQEVTHWHREVSKMHVEERGEHGTSGKGSRISSNSNASTCTETEFGDEVDEFKKTGLVNLRTAAVTPLRVLPFMEAPEETNRIIRQYMRFKDRFLRVSFASDNLTKLGCEDFSSDVIQRLKSVMLNGLKLCNRTFVFLAYSNSQLREHSCWLYCEQDRHLDCAPSADQIRTAAGDISHIKIPSRYAARLGQCFSTTYETLELSRGDVCELPEVEAEPKAAGAAPEVFSDGIGVITYEGMREVVGKLPLVYRMKLLGQEVSGIQIRMGGCKGVLVLWDDVRGMRAGARVGIRPSMKKFESNALKVEVCRVASVLPCFLNRQVMMALLSLGLKPEVLWRHYEAFVGALDSLLDGGESTLELLAAMGCVDPFASDEVHVSPGCLAACMTAAGLQPREDPLLMSLVQAYRGYALKQVQEKCRIPVQDAVTLMGALDESGSLPPGKFWACWDPSRHSRGFSTTEPNHLPPGTRCIVSRAPCMSPSDIRVLEAADPSNLPQSLTTLRNLVVFPSIGPRPEQCLMSGGDLDGDMYFLIWDQNLLPPRQAEGLDYAHAGRPKEIDGDVTVAHVIESFVHYMQNDQLGRIANGHLALADSSEQLANDAKCEQLVKLASTAVDFAKTGVPVNPGHVSALLRDVEYPDFLGGRRKSTTVVGQISRDARGKTDREITSSYETWLGAKAHAQAQRREAGGVEACFRLPVAPATAAWAAGAVDSWARDFLHLMTKFGVDDVGQVVTGRVTHFFGLPTGTQKNADNQARVNRELALLIRQHEQSCFPEMHGGAGGGGGYAVDGGAGGGGCEVEVSELHTGMPTTPTMAPGVAKTIAQGIPTLALQDEHRIQYVLSKVGGLYQAAHRALDDPTISNDELLVRLACPWHLAAKLLASCKKLMQQEQA